MSWRARALSAARVLLVALLCFPPVQSGIGTMVDQSWAIGLQLAWRQRLAHGRDVVFPYGPMGWLGTTAMTDTALAVVALLVRIVLLVVAAWVCVRLVDRRLGPWASSVTRGRRLLALALCTVAALPVTWLVGALALTGGDLPVVVCSLVWLLACWFAVDRPDRSITAVVVLAFVGGALVTVKFEQGLSAVLVVGLLALLGADPRGLRLLPPRARAIGERSERDGRIVSGLVGGVLAAGAALLGLLVAWIGNRQPVGALPRWLKAIAELTKGYPPAMVIDAASVSQRWWTALLTGSALVPIVLIARRAPRGRRAVAVSVPLAAVLLTARQSSVRVDPGHLARGLIISAAVWVVLGRGRVLAAGAVVVVLAVWQGQGMRGLGSADFLRPVEAVDHARTAVKQLTSSAERRAIHEMGYQQAGALDVPDEMLQQLRTGDVHVEPADIVVAWVHRLRWNPLPVIQTYQANTMWLDRLDADKLAGPTAPRYVLFDPISIDDRIPRWESPAAMTTMLCNYRMTSIHWRWVLFERRTDGPGGSSDVCGAPRVLQRVRARFGVPVPTPEAPPGTIVVARYLGTGPGLLGAVRESLTRPAKLYALLPGTGDRPHRFVPDTAAAPHVLSLPACITEQWGSFDTRRFEAVTLSTGPRPSGDRTYTVEFAAIPYRCP